MEDDEGDAGEKGRIGLELPGLKTNFIDTIRKGAALRGQSGVNIFKDFAESGWIGNPFYRRFDVFRRARRTAERKHVEQQKQAKEHVEQQMSLETRRTANKHVEQQI